MDSQELITRKMSEYVDLGLPVFPLCSHNHSNSSTKHVERCKCAGKTPLIRNWTNRQETSESDLQTWVRDFKQFNIGLPLGDASGYVGIDIDGSEGENFLQIMSDGNVPDTWEFKTGDGRRLIYQIPVGMATKKFKMAEKGHQECALLCTGQQTVLPPSIHHTGRLYEWLEGHSPFDCDCVMAPTWLIDKIRVVDVDNTFRLVLPDKPKPPTMLESLEAEFAPVDMAAFVESIPNNIIPPKTGNVKQGKHTVTVTEAMLTSPIPDGMRDDTMTAIIGHFCAKYRPLGKDNIMMLALKHNEQYCQPPLELSAIEAKVSHFWELEQIKTAQYKDQVDNKAKFEPSVIAQTILNVWDEKGFIVKVQAGGRYLWMCHKTKGPWKAIASRDIEFWAMFRHIACNPKYNGHPSWSTVKHLNDIGSNILTLLGEQGRYWQPEAVDTHNVESDFCKYIPLKDGTLLDWRTRQKVPWNPEIPFTYTLDIVDDPDAKCPYWDARLVEWLPDADTRKLIQEYIGYCLIPYMGLEAALLITGEGSNGKSVFMNAVRQMLGQDVVGSANISFILSKFGTHDLYGKILNICDEKGADFLKDSQADRLKLLISGQSVTADVKNKSPIKFYNTAKFIFSANKDLRSSDKTAGWLRRWVMVPFDQIFESSNVSVAALNQGIRAERAGIFNWALEGLQRLISQNNFTESQLVKKRIRAYTSENDIAADFFVNCLEEFDITTCEAFGQIARWGTPTSLVNSLFDMWIEYRESSVQRKKKHLSEYIEKARHIKKERTKFILHSMNKQTMCWIGVRLMVNDTEFLEKIKDEGEVNMKVYAEKRLKELDAESEVFQLPTYQVGQ